MVSDRALGVRAASLTGRKSYARIADVLDVPDLIQVQIRSFEWFQREGLKELFEEISPIEDFNRNRLSLEFENYHFEEPKYSEQVCRERDMTFAARLHVTVKLTVKETGEVKVQRMYLGDFPIMTSRGTFIINGAERVVVSQLVRSPGVYFLVEKDAGHELCSAKLIPNRGAWLEFETSSRGVLSVKIDRKRKIPVTILLRAVGYGTDDVLREAFADVLRGAKIDYLQNTIDKQGMTFDKQGHPIPITNETEALLEFYRRLRPGDPPTEDNSRKLRDSLFFDPRRYDLGRVGRYKLNKRLQLDPTYVERILRPMDLLEIVRELIRVNRVLVEGDSARQLFAPGLGHKDDIDHLGNRRVRAVGELIQNQFRVGLLRMERVVKERMSIQDAETATPSALINIRPVVAALKEFFGGSQLSQFMDQTNPLAELTHKRRLSALGPGGLSRDRAGFEVRDVHHSHYGRICPIETPEGPSIGLIGSLATYGQINEYGFIETPYRRVIREVENGSSELVGHTLRETLKDANGEVVAERGSVITDELVARLRGLPMPRLRVEPVVSENIEYLSADQEELYSIAQANSVIDEQGHFVDGQIEARRGESFIMVPPDQIDYMDVSPKQLVSVAASLIPFLEHDDANRALMGSNMQRQAVPLVRPEAPLVGTGMEWQAAVDSGQVVIAEEAGEVVRANAREVVVRGDDGTERGYSLQKFLRSNQGTCINQRPIVQKGDLVTKGQPLADSSSTDQGELALGQNVLCAFMSWEGNNFEDAIILSESVVRDDKFTSIHIEKHETEARDTKLGPEEITRDIPNVGEESLRDLDENGIIRIGAEVGPGDILVGKITPKGETELTAEEKLLRAIFGEKAREVKDTSLRVPHGERGKVVDVKVFSRENHEELPAGVNQLVRVSIAQKRKLSEGDKMAGRHGNKGVVATIRPIEDMPFLADGTPIEIILNPIGVPSRMNVGQVLETHLGMAAEMLGFKVQTPVFDGAREDSMEEALARAWLVTQAEHHVASTEPRHPEGTRSDESVGVSRENGTHASSLVPHASVSENGETPAEPEAPVETPARLVRELTLNDRVDLAHHWLTREGYDADAVLRSDGGGLARRACFELWLRALGADAAEDIRERMPDSSATSLRELSDADLFEYAERVAKQRGAPLPTQGKAILFDGRSGEPFDRPVTVGYIYMLKLVHLVEDKIHARSTGPYSLITQQPLGGKAQFGGQRFGEMEVWALEAYGAAHILQEILTVKSDDVVGRVKTYEAIVKGENIMEPGVPESFKVLVKELQSLGLSVEVLNEDEEAITFKEDIGADVPELGINIAGFEGGSD